MGENNFRRADRGNRAGGSSWLSSIGAHGRSEGGGAGASSGRLRRFRPGAGDSGALAAAAGFEAVQYGFSLYVTYFGHYNKIYGSLGAIVAFLFFIYLASSVFLFGAEIAAEYPRLRAGPGRAPPSDSPCQGSGAGNGAGHSRAAGLRN